VLTDLAPELSDASWYGLRSWIEQFFKDGKRGGWQWQRTRMTEAARAERLWLGLAVATLWLVRVGGMDLRRGRRTAAGVGGGVGVRSAARAAVAVGERVRAGLGRARGGAGQPRPPPAGPAAARAVASRPAHAGASPSSVRDQKSGMKTYT
jgi:hypothetical protein